MQSLSDLVLNYPLTDKGPKKSDGTNGHNYTEFYESFFSQIREEKLNILEIGFGGGDSLKMWAEYFPNSQIYCLDNNLQRIVEYNYKHHPRIKILFADQSMSESLNKAVEEIGLENFDIIIDDGSHFERDIRVSYETLFPLINKDGIYFIEDAPHKLTFDENESISLSYFESAYTPAYLISIKKNKII